MFIASTIFLFFISPPLFSSPSPNSVFFSSHFKLYNCLFPSFLLWIVGALLNQIRGVYGSIVKYLPSRAQRRYCLVIQERSGGGRGVQGPKRKEGWGPGFLVYKWCIKYNLGGTVWCVSLNRRKTRILMLKLRIELNLCRAVKIPKFIKSNPPSPCSPPSPKLVEI